MASSSAMSANSTGRAPAAVPSPAAMSPELSYALAHVEGGGAIPALWLPMAVFGHIFAIVFFTRALLLYMPSLKPRLREALRTACCVCCRRGNAREVRAPQPPPADPSRTARELQRLSTVQEGPECSPRPSRDGDGPEARGGGFSTAMYGSNNEDEDGEAGGGDDVEEAGLHGLRGKTNPYGNSKALEAALGYGNDDGDDGVSLHGKARGGPKQVVLEWRGISLAVNSPRGVVPVLRDVGGRAPAGAVTALLGPSGAGKSTLLDLLALRGAAGLPEGPRQLSSTSTGQPQPQRGHPGQLGWKPPALSAGPTAAAAPSSPGCSGQVLVNGEPRDSKAFLAMSSYVPQEDAFLPQLTVREALLFTGRLVLRPPQCRPAAVAARASAVAAALGLGGQMETLIGGVLPGGLLLRGLSGGERRRLSIGQGLMSRPRVLMLDEPTSGLDSFAAAVVMGHLAALAAAGSGGGGANAAPGGGGGVTVVASLHQPRAAIWELVQQVVVLGRGRLLYCGPPSELLPWFGGRLGYCYRPQHHGLVSDWVMDLVALPTSSSTTTNCTDNGHGNGNGNGNLNDASSGVCGGRGSVTDPRVARARGGSTHGTDGCAHISECGESGEEDDSDDDDDASEGPAAIRGPQVMATLAELNSAADAFAAAVLAAPPAPGISVGVPDYSNVLAAAAVTAAPPVPHALPPNVATPLAQPTLVVGGGAKAGRSVRFEGDGAAGGGGGGAGGTAAALSWRATLSAAFWRWCRQYRMLLWREWLIATRNPADVAGRMLSFVWVGLFSNFLTYGLPSDATGIALRVNLLFALVFFFLVMPFIFMSLFAADKRFFLLEAAARGGGGGGLYAPSAYYAAKVSATAPLNMIIALTFNWIGYGMLGMRRSVLALAQNTTCAVLMSLISLHWVQAAVAFSPNQDIAFCASVAFSVLNLLLSTQFLGAFKLTIPWIGKLRAASALDQTWRGLMSAEFRNRAFLCGPNGSNDPMGTGALGLYSQFIPANPRFNIIRYGMSTRGANCVVATNSLLSYYDIDVSTGTTVGILFAYLAAIHLITYIALRRAVASKSRRSGGGADAGSCCGWWAGWWRARAAQLVRRPAAVLATWSKTSRSSAAAAGATPQRSPRRLATEV